MVVKYLCDVDVIPKPGALVEPKQLNSNIGVFTPFLKHLMES